MLLAFMLNSNNDKKQKFELETLVQNNEKILFKEKPHKKAYFAYRTLTFLPIVVINFVFCMFNLLRFFLTEGALEDPIFVSIFISIFAGVLLAPFWIWLVCLIVSMCKLKYLEYIITNERFILRTGKKQSKIAIINNIDIINAKIFMNKSDKKFNTGHIRIATFQDWFSIHSITNYYDIGKHLERICKINEEYAKPYNQQQDY